MAGRWKSDKGKGKGFIRSDATKWQPLPLSTFTLRNEFLFIIIYIWLFISARIIHKGV
jgi:hypothetical protein